MTYDIIIKDGTIVDGTGAPRFAADVAIANGKIAEIGRVTDSAAETIDAPRPDRRARLRRSAYPLRRPNLLGPPHHVVLMAWRDQS